MTCIPPVGSFQVVQLEDFSHVVLARKSCMFNKNGTMPQVPMQPGAQGMGATE